MTDSHFHHDLKTLILAQLDDCITPEQYQTLQHLLNEDSDARRYYTEYIMLCAALKRYATVAPKIDQTDEDFDVRDNQLWDALAEFEKTAPRVKIDNSSVQNLELIQSVEYPRVNRKISRSSILSFAVVAAAVLLMFLFVKLTPVSNSIELVTLTNSMGAKWADMDGSMQNGTRLFADDKTSFLLRRGLVELQFDTHARVVIEAPAEFQILAEDRIGLRYGKIFAMVPQEGIGFSIYTQNAKVIDLGTEFGVHADINGDTYLHVIKGKTMLIAGEQSDKKSSIEVGKGYAKTISGSSAVISDMPCDTQLFVRTFNPESNFAWRGQTGLDLADITAGQGKFGGLKTNVWLGTSSGYSERPTYGGGEAQKDYVAIADNPYIDGLFVPGGSGQQTQVVSSRGDLFQECPSTIGLFYMSLGVNPDPSLIQSQNNRIGTILFDGIQYGTLRHPCIMMHANLGITYDLKAIRTICPDRKVKRLTAKIGIADLQEPYACNADFWVLVDGQVRYSLQQYKQKGTLTEIVVEIQESDQFLTLITTDGGDVDSLGAYKRSYTCDWCIFAEPVLEFE